MRIELIPESTELGFMRLRFGKQQPLPLLLMLLLSLDAEIQIAPQKQQERHPDASF